MKHKLDEYEQDLEDNFENMKIVTDKAEYDLIKTAAKNFLKNKKHITLRVLTHDLEVIRIKASRLGIPYQTYINMLIHRDATKRNQAQ